MVALIVLDVDEDGACHASGNREHDANIVAWIDVFPWVACGCCDDEDEHYGEQDDGDVEECCKKDEVKVPFGE